MTSLPKLHPGCPKLTSKVATKLRRSRLICAFGKAWRNRSRTFTTTQAKPPVERRSERESANSLARIP
ncbi:hypothetical protein ACVWWO_003021 [Bradyrhizobium sp. F1.13.1]